MDNYIVAFIDILGFKNLVSNGNIQQTVDDYSEVLSKLRHYWEDIPIKSKFESTLFSDSIILCLKISQNPSIDTKREEYKAMFIAVGHLQVELINKGIWIRGGISHGEMVYDKRGSDTKIYGKAFVKAYELESKYAIFPRVVIDPTIIDELEFRSKRDFLRYMNNNDFTNWKNDIIFNSKHLYQNRVPRHIEEDVRLFIDYIEPAFQVLNKNEISEMGLAKLKKSLEMCIADFPHAFEKYNWVRKLILQKLEIKLQTSQPHELNIKILGDLTIENYYQHQRNEFSNL